MAETQRDNEETNATTSVGKTENFVSKHFVRLLVWLAVSGGALAIFGPWLLYVAGYTGETDANLRLHILYVTGGTLAVLGLVETHRKNTTDRIKADADIQNYQASQDHQAKTLAEQARHFTETIAKEREKIETDKAKNEQDHIRQVHAERRSRYTTAIEQLSSDKASIRLGGVYALVGLVDEWLADDKTIPNIEERRKEGQVIINNLCAYIRSPFLLAERAKQLDAPYAKDLQKNFGGDIEKFNEDKQYFAQEKAALEEERQVRQSIIKEMREHLSKNYSKSGPWSDFDYDFSDAHFFYPVNFNDSYFGTSIVNFSGATFTQADFIGVTFAWTNFIGVTFAWANFSRATFTQDANFFEVTFTERADFSEAEFNGNADLSEAEFNGNADFSWAKFTGYANLSETKFTQDADFSAAEFIEASFSAAKFNGNAEFSTAEFADASFSATEFIEASFSAAKFNGNADFSWAKFTGYANLSETKFTQDADFSEAEFNGNADFHKAAFAEASFYGAEFIEASFSAAEFNGNADFHKAAFENKPIFEYTLDNKTYKARFSCKVAPGDYNFEVSHISPYKIETEEQEHNGVKFIIPKGTELFDPDDPFV